MLRTVSLPVNLIRGNLYLCSMPGRFEALEIFFQEIAEAKIGHILCLVSDQEIAKKSPDYLAAIRQNQIPAKLWRYDVPDYGLPENPEGLNQTVDCIRERLDNGESVVIHCAAGRGRTGMISILLLTRMGLPLDVAIQTIRRAGSAPDTEAQMDYLHRHARSKFGNDVMESSIRGILAELGVPDLPLHAAANLYRNQVNLGMAHYPSEGRMFTLR